MNRKERAAATRGRMVEAAYSAFSSRGYAKTTMDAVAAAAGVAVQTVYFTFHTKAELLQATYEYAVLGPDGVPPHLTTWWRAAEEEADPCRALDHIVAGTIQVLDRAAPLVVAVYRDEDARPAYELNEQLRVDGYSEIVRILVRKHALRTGRSRATARDILLTVLGPHVFFLLTRERGWSHEKYAKWAHAALLHELFALDT